MRRRFAIRICLAMLVWLVGACWLCAESRVAVITALSEELELLRGSAVVSATNIINQSPVYEGVLGGQQVVIQRCGKSMVNAAMNTQALLDRYSIRSIVFSGIAGGCNPELKIGDVVVPQQWANHYEHLLARKEGEGWNTDGHRTPFAGTNTHYGMMFPRVQTVYPDNKKKYVEWFPVDSALLEKAKALPGKVTLRHVSAEGHALPGEPKMIIGGNGVSGSAFVENAAYREWLWKAFEAQAIDMESTAVAQVAYMNKIPCIIFRSLSDLAGADSSADVRLAFRQLVADNSARTVIQFLESLSVAP